ncbi:MAG: phosphodiester glycosidase family protein [Lachnospiraceae bacterium]|jgi:exopolysaccharide biosynthesis protein|nr:phosphodiester glycosidase family protein [Lachnospiraceae bacterium]
MKKIIIRIVICFFTVIALALTACLAVLFTIHYGPSKTFRDKFSLSAMESSAGDFLATWFLPDEVIAQIIADSTIKPSDTVTDPGMIAINIGNEIAGSLGDEDSGEGNDEGGQLEYVDNFDEQGVYFVDIVKKNYKAKLMIVADPLRVSIGTPRGGYGENKAGETTVSMAKRTKSLAAVNGGGFIDGTRGTGNGGVPSGRNDTPGIVISEGQLLWGNLNTKYELIGFNSEGVLILGNMTGKQALNKDIREALNFGPFLIINGEKQNLRNGGGLNPRTAIGQRKDGAVLLLVVEGRQPHSLGATFNDLTQIFLEYGAVNAANLDGGTSSFMVYENEIVTQRSTFLNPRRMATSILVSRLEQ